MHAFIFGHLARMACDIHDVCGGGGDLSKGWKETEFRDSRRGRWDYRRGQIEGFKGEGGGGRHGVQSDRVRQMPQEVEEREKRVIRADNVCCSALAQQ